MRRKTLAYSFGPEFGGCLNKGNFYFWCLQNIIELIIIGANEKKKQ